VSTQKYCSGGMLIFTKWMYCGRFIRDWELHMLKDKLAYCVIDTETMEIKSKF